MRTFIQLSMVCVLSFCVSPLIWASDANGAANNVHALVDQGWALENEGRSQQALALFNKALEMDPDDFLVHKHLGIHWAREGRFVQAIQELNLAVELNPRDASSNYNLGLVYQVHHEYEKAVASYTRAINLNANYSSAIQNRAHAYWDLKDYKDAIKDYSRIIAKNPQMEGALLFALAFVLMVLVLTVVIIWRWNVANGIVMGNLRMAAEILYTNPGHQPGPVQSMEGSYRGRTILVEYLPWATQGRYGNGGRKVYVKAPVHLPPEGTRRTAGWFEKFLGLPSKPTEFTVLMGKDLVYAESLNCDGTNLEWQQRPLSKQEITLMFDRLVEGALAVEAGKSEEQRVNGASQAALRQRSRMLLMGIGVFSVGISLLAVQNLSNHASNRVQYLIFLLFFIFIVFVNGGMRRRG